MSRSRHAAEYNQLISEIKVAGTSLRIASPDTLAKLQDMEQRAGTIDPLSPYPPSLLSLFAFWAGRPIHLSSSDPEAVDTLKIQAFSFTAFAYYLSRLPDTLPHRLLANYWSSLLPAFIDVFRSYAKADIAACLCAEDIVRRVCGLLHTIAVRSSQIKDDVIEHFPCKELYSTDLCVALTDAWLRAATTPEANIKYIRTGEGIGEAKGRLVYAPFYDLVVIRSVLPRRPGMPGAAAVIALPDSVILDVFRRTMEVSASDDVHGLINDYIDFLANAWDLSTRPRAVLLFNDCPRWMCHIARNQLRLLASKPHATDKDKTFLLKNALGGLVFAYSNGMHGFAWMEQAIRAGMIPLTLKLLRQLANLRVASPNLKANIVSQSDALVGSFELIAIHCNRPGIRRALQATMGKLPRALGQEYSSKAREKWGLLVEEFEHSMDVEKKLGTTRYNARPCCSIPHCGRGSSLRCKGCLAATYCSEACQRKHWSMHRDQCHAIEKDVRDGQAVSLGELDWEVRYLYFYAAMDIVLKIKSGAFATMRSAIPGGERNVTYMVDYTSVPRKYEVVVADTVNRWREGFINIGWIGSGLGRSSNDPMHGKKHLRMMDYRRLSELAEGYHTSY